MNEECKRILLRQQAFDQALKKVPIQFAKTVFLMENGFPRKNYSYNAYLLKVADALGIERFSPHALRHTYAPGVWRRE
ncbi:MAG: hypothetical protein J5532_10175 [Lachnospiraceae bacterium]|nr:hypothetical protein [Lachnospiraceae bacterium]